MEIGNKLEHELIGQILLKTGKIDQDALNKALLIQKNNYLPLGEILSKEFSISSSFISESINFQENQKVSKITILKDKVGQLLKKLGIINEKNISEILNIQQKEKKRFGEIAVEKNLISKNFFDDILSASNGCKKSTEKLVSKKLGELLVDLRYINEDILENSLEEQKNNKKLLGQILLEKGLTLKDKLQKALKVQKKLASLTIVSLFSISVLASCSTPRVPFQTDIGIVENYSQGKLLKVLSTNKSGSVNYYNDGTIAVTNVPFFQQGNDNTCGQAVMASILSYWGKNVSYQKVVNDTNPGNLPTDVDKITNYLRKHGLYAQDYRLANLNFVKDRISKGFPVIMLLDFGTLNTEHYVIATGFNDNTQELILLDPIDGPNMRILYTQVAKMWENKSLRNLGIFGDKYNRIVFDIAG